MSLHVIVWYCMVWYCLELDDIAMHFMVLHSIALLRMISVLHFIVWNFIVLHGIACNCIVLYGIGNGIACYCMVLHCIVSNHTVLHGIAFTIIGFARRLYLARHMCIARYIHRSTLSYTVGAFQQNNSLQTLLKRISPVKKPFHTLQWSLAILQS